MPIVPEEWSVVIPGAWNRAILTPAGISRRLFQLPEGTPLEIEVPLDTFGPFRVKHGDLSVTADSNRLVIAPAKNSDENMAKALKLALVALTSLPETPVSAAGFNFKYKSKQLVESLARIVEHDADQFFADRQYSVLSRAIGRTIKWRQGEIRLSVIQESDFSCTILINFHMASSSASVLHDWLSVSIDDARQEIDTIFFNYLEIPEGEISHAE